MSEEAVETTTKGRSHDRELAERNVLRCGSGWSQGCRVSDEGWQGVPDTWYGDRKVLSRW